MDITVTIPRVGSIQTIEGKRCAILKTITYQEEIGGIVTKVTYLPVSDNGDDLGEDTFIRTISH